VEDPSQHLDRDPDPRILHPKDGVGAFLGDTDSDAAATRCVLERVVEQVADDLLQASRVTVNEDRPSRRLHLVSGAPSFALQNLEGLAHDLVEVDGFALQNDLPDGDAGDVEDIVEQAAEMSRLSADQPL